MGDGGELREITLNSNAVVVIILLLLLLLLLNVILLWEAPEWTPKFRCGVASIFTKSECFVYAKRWASELVRVIVVTLGLNLEPLGTAPVWLKHTCSRLVETRPLLSRTSI